MFKINKPLLFYIIIVIGLFIFLANLPNQLNPNDGTNHFIYANENNCGSGYANGVCVLTQNLGLNINSSLFWSFFYWIAILLLPLIIYYYTKELLIFPAWLLFSGFFFVEETMQVYAQLLLAIVFVYFLYSKKNLQKAFVWIILFSLAWFNLFKIHQYELHFLIGIAILEIVFILKEKRFFLGVCALIPSKLVTGIGASENYFRQAVNNGTSSAYQLVVYYGYSFFWENMFILFMYFGLKESLESNTKHLIYFIGVLLISFLVWWYTGWSNWYVTRIVLFIPLILIYPFVVWFNKQNDSTKTLFWELGVFYFSVCLFLFLRNKIEMMC